METKIDAVILAGGLGTRLKKIVPNLPKPLSPIHGRPFLDILLNQLSAAGCIKNTVIAVGYKSDQIIDTYSKNTNFGFKIAFSVEDQLLGTGGAIKKALHSTTTEKVLVMNGDSFIDVDIPGLIRSHNLNGADFSIVLKEVENADRYGNVLMADTGKINYFSEKNALADGGKNYINAGIYLINASVFENIAQETVLSLEKDILPELVKGRVYGYVASGKFIDIGTPAPTPSRYTQRRQ